MEMTRRHRTSQVPDQENVYVVKGKANVLPAKKQEPNVRAALKDLNANVQVQRDVNIFSKVSVYIAEFEKKASLCRSSKGSSYNHVQSNVDTGFPKKNVHQLSARPSLLHEDSTSGHAVKAFFPIMAAVKETTTKKDTATISKKADAKKNTTKNEEKKEAIAAIKPILKEESTESLGKLKIEETTSHLVNVTKLKQALSQFKTSLDTFSEFPANYIKDFYKYLMELEIKYQIEPNHLRNQSVITPKMRSELLDWLVEIHQQCKFLLETLHLAVGIIDRYLQVTSNVQCNQFQLIGVTALFIACKYEERFVLRVENCVYMTDRAYSKKEIIRCELDIMAKLNFCLARPTPQTFLNRFVTVSHGNSTAHHLAEYFVDLCLIDYSMAHYRPSELSAAAVCLSLYLLSTCRDPEDVWTRSLKYYSTYAFDHIEPIIRKIAQIVVAVGNSKYKSVNRRYQDDTQGSVSNLPQLKSKTLYELINSPRS